MSLFVKTAMKPENVHIIFEVGFLWLDEETEKEISLSRIATLVDFGAFLLPRTPKMSVTMFVFILSYYTKL